MASSECSHGCSAVGDRIDGTHVASLETEKTRLSNELPISHPIAPLASAADSRSRDPLLLPDEDHVHEDLSGILSPLALSPSLSPSSGDAK